MNNVQLEGAEIQVVDMYGKRVDVVGANYCSPLPFFFIQKYMPQYASVTPNVMPNTIGKRSFRLEKVMGISKAANKIK